MARLQNERGYALLTVLLTITLFIILFLSFLGQAFSTMKQNRVIEKDSQSVALAEMGISYYHAEVKSIYEDKQQIVYDKVQEKINTDMLAGITFNQSFYKEYAATLMEGEIRAALGDKELPVDGKPTDTINILLDKDSIDFNEETNEIVLQYTSIGNEDGKTTELIGNMYINIWNPEQLGGGPNIFLEIPEFNKVTPPEVTRLECRTPSSLKVALAESGNGQNKIAGCTKIIVEEDKVYAENPNKMENTVIYSNHNLSLGNANSADHLDLHAKNLTMDKNMNNLTNSVIETKEDATFESNLTIHFSNLYIGGDLNVTGEQFKLQNSGNNGNGGPDSDNLSSAFVRGTVNLKKAETAANTTMCVKEDLYADSLSLSGKLYIQGKLNVGGKEYTEEEMKTAYPNATVVNATTDQDLLEQECGVTFAPPELFIGWGESVTNNVVYN